MEFSLRTNWNLEESHFAAAVRGHRAAGHKLFDLTVSNPTICGFVYEDAALLAPLTHPSAIAYEPDPLGAKDARNSIAAYYRDAEAIIPEAHLCLTTSTSEAYSFLFRLLCNAGDEVLIARPSYPLFEYIACLDDVRLMHYPLLYDPNADLATGHGWRIDLHALESSITARTRAVIVVHPNNPTGHFVSDEEREALQNLCVKHGLALIADEVFLDYPIHGNYRSFAAGDAPCLTFVMSGISKVCGLPQMKASWIAAVGPSTLVGGAMQRLEVIADTFLSMNAPTQFALPFWLQARHSLQKQIRDRIAVNLSALDQRLRNTMAQRLALQGGWTAVLRVPRMVKDIAFEEAALNAGVLVLPGHFYDLDAGKVVVSLLTQPEIWALGLRRLPID